MIKVCKYADLGQADFGWLKARYHFSFAKYRNMNRINFGTLCVINDDIIKPMTGFDTHPHDNMEIITYVRSGVISHQDSAGNTGKIFAGSVQVMSAGTGILHSEHNMGDDMTTLYQIWIKPKQHNVIPRWDTKSFPVNWITDKLTLLASCDGTAPLFINQDAFIYAGRLKEGMAIAHKIHNQVYILASDGEFFIDDTKLVKGDGAEITNVESITINAVSDCEILVIDVPQM